MSATADNAPLGGFEQRLLAQLLAQVEASPATTAAVLAPPMPRVRRLAPPVRLRRGSLPAAAGLVALATGVLSLLPAAAPSLAQAFPILAGEAHVLPARLVRVLRAEWGSRAGPGFDLRRAYAFRTAAGTGYVVVDRRARWLCILVPSFASASGSGRCEKVTLARLGEPALTLRISSGGRQEIVGLLPRGASASVTAAAGASPHQLRLPNGVLAIVARGPVTVTTTLAGHRGAQITYRP